MPIPTGNVLPLSLNTGERARLRNALQSRALYLLEPVYLAENEPSFDEALATFLLCSIAASDNEKHPYLPHRLAQMKFMVKQLNLNLEPEGFDEESAEERRRFWWSAWIIDRHSSFSFNMRTVMVDADCQNLYRPCPDSLWDDKSPMVDSHSLQSRQKGVDYQVRFLDYFGILIPLFAILGDILEYQHILQHNKFGKNSDILRLMRQSIEESLDIWSSSVRSLCGTSPAYSAGDRSSFKVWSLNEWRVEQPETTYPSEPKLLLYAWHIFHCLYIVLYGKLDLFQMYRDAEWLLSNDFLIAAEHAGQCATITAKILSSDPKLHVCNRLFGTYLLHSSFIFLILAKKLRHSADAYILSCCHTNQRSLDAFAATVNISYQKTFARVLQDTISNCLEAREEQMDITTDRPAAAEVEEPLDATAEEVFGPGLSKYRWAPGFNGLWPEDMGRPKEAQMRQFKNSHPPV
ncbi:hypothetical protein BX600DRAFT_513447 [Xylariales sp. PMI_506]|nr:hypothetical protein BX600DRAFT_513447 [Xylariales sp. PMI_506]